MRSLVRWIIVGVAAALAVTAGVLATADRSSTASPPDACVVGEWTVTSIHVLTNLGAAWAVDSPTAGRLRLGADGHGSYTTDGAWIEFTSVSEYGNVDRHRVNEVAAFGYSTTGGTMSFADLDVRGREGRPGLEKTIPPGYVFMELSSLISSYGGTSATRYACGAKEMTLTHADDTMTLTR
jgi:hypothetical protein